MNGKKITILLKKYTSGNCTKKEINQIITYFKTQPKLEDFPEVEEILAQEKNEYQKLSAEQAASIFNTLKTKTSNNKFIKQIILSSLKYAAVLLIMVTSAFFLYQNINNTVKPNKINTTISTDVVSLTLGNGNIIKLDLDKEIVNASGERLGEIKGNKLILNELKHIQEESFVNIINVPNGLEFTVSLEDGSQVVLNSGSKITFPSSFKNYDQRKITLSGEAFFKITKNPNKPFIVNTNTINVTVLGTQFNVNSYKKNKNVEVVLTEGSIALTTHNLKSEKRILKPGEKAIYNKNTARVHLEKTNVNIETAWLKGDLIMRDLTFKEIIFSLERKYNVHIISENKKINNTRLNAKISTKTEGISEVMDMFSKLLNTTYLIENNTITINPKK